MVRTRTLPGGSSPRARGAPAARPGPGQGLGIIPACAGSTVSPSPASTARQDHPRVRGEHSNPCWLTAVSPGSSPRARGALEPGVNEYLHPGIIPACAGSTEPAPLIDPRPGDHPRVRGEHGFSRFGVGVGPGSSPRARGAPASGAGTAPRRGIIPACAGSTRCTRSWRAGARDHPRVRGEHASWEGAVVEVMGSSPRARGAR